MLMRGIFPSYVKASVDAQCFDYRGVGLKDGAKRQVLGPEGETEATSE
jgi:hypothetical protein